MLKIKNNNFKENRLPLILGALGICGMFLYSYLTFIPNQAFADSLIVDPNEHRSLSQISTMQEMSQQICINSREEETKQLEDTRDHKTYWVTKLKDGNCWMTQNLDLDLNSSIPLTPADSDVVSSWTSSSAYPLVTTRTGDINSGWLGPEAAQSWDPGNYYYVMDDDWTNCGSDMANFSYCNRWATSASNEESPHYHVGNYYSWVAATAGTGGGTTGGLASGSICPKNWKLPTGGNTDTANFTKLVGAYGIRTSIGEDSSVNNVIRQTPLYFIPSGRVDAHSGGAGLSYAGTYGFYQSSIAVSNLQAYGLMFGNGYIYPWGGGDGFERAMSVRCVAEGGWLDYYLSDTASSNVAITVSPVISIDATSGMNEDVDFTRVATGNISASISSNQPYQVLLSTTQTTLEQHPVLEDQNIPMIATDQDIVAGINSWGVKKKLSATTGVAGDITDAPLYSPIGINDDKELFFRSAAAESKTLKFAVGIAVSPELPSGKYSTQVTITAVAN